MIKLVFCVKRYPHISRAEFQEYWLKHHGPMVQGFAEALRAVRYVQSHTIDSPLNENLKESRGLCDEYDGIAEIWWRSEEDFLVAVTSTEGQKLRRVFIEDEAKFINHSTCSAFFTVEHILIDRSM